MNYHPSYGVMHVAMQLKLVDQVNIGPRDVHEPAWLELSWATIFFGSAQLEPKILARAKFGSWADFFTLMKFWKKKKFPSTVSTFKGFYLYYVLKNLCLFAKFQDVDFFAQYEVERMFVFNMIAVDSGFGGRGIGTQLMMRAVQFAFDKGFRVLTAETTGVASAKIFQKLDFQQVKEMAYDDYTDEEGNKPFKNLHPHRACIVWVKLADK